MSDTRVRCPRCSQAWLLRIRLVPLEQDAVFCPECEALWLAGEDIALGTFRDYSTYVMERGRVEPQASGEYLVRGPFTNER